jgi:hypothetical protein
LLQSNFESEVNEEPGDGKYRCCFRSFVSGAPDINTSTVTSFRLQLLEFTVNGLFTYRKH